MKKRLKEVCEFYSGTGFPIKYQGDSYGDLPFYKVSDIANNEIMGNCFLDVCNNYISYDTVREIKGTVIPRNVVVFAKIGEALKLNRRCITSSDCLIDNNAMGIGCNEKYLEIKYFYFFMKNLKLEKLAESTTIPSVRKTKLEELFIEVPNMELQLEIARTLEVIQDIILYRQKQLIQMDKLIKARFFELFGDLVEGDKIKENRRKIGDIASVTKLAGFEFTKYIKYKDIGSIGDVIMLRGLNCKRGKIILDDIKWIERETSDLLPRSKLYIGDILITYAGTIGDVALVDEDNKYHLAPNVGKITIIDKLSYDPVFLVHLLMYSNKYIMSFVSKVAQASINMQKIRNFEYYFPGFEKQKYFSTFVEQVNKSKVEVQKALDKAQLLFDSLMQKYFG